MHDAVVIVCDTPARADADADRSMSRSDAVAKHLTDGIGNTRVVTTVEGWKTNGIDRAELEHLMKDAQLTTCRLRDEIRPR